MDQKLFEAYQDHKKTILSNIEKVDNNINDILGNQQKDAKKKKINSLTILNTLEKFVEINYILETLITEIDQENNNQHKTLSQSSNNNSLVSSSRIIPDIFKPENAEEINENVSINGSPLLDETNPFKNSLETITNQFSLNQNQKDNEGNVEIDSNVPYVSNLTPITNPLENSNSTINNCTVDKNDYLEQLPIAVLIPEKDICNVDPKCSGSNLVVENLKKFQNIFKEKQNNSKINYSDLLPHNFQLKPVENPIQLMNNDDFSSKTLDTSNAVYNIPSDELKENSTVFFTHIVSPSEFYVSTNKELFDLMEDELNNGTHDVPKFKNKSEARTYLGDYCIAYISKYSTFYRAYVYDWIMDENDYDDIFVMLKLIDLGQNLECSYRNLYPIKGVFVEIHQLAIQCHFEELFPLDNKKTWPNNTIKEMMELTGYDSQPILFTVTYANFDGESYGVDLCGIDSEKSLAEILIEKNLAVDDLHFVINNEQKNDKENIIFDDEDDSDAYIECDDINEAVTGYSARDEARICRFTDESGRCFKGNRCKLEHIKPSKDWVTTDTQFIAVRTLNSLNLPHEGARILIVITAYINCCRFYVQIINEPVNNHLEDSNLINLINSMNSKSNLDSFLPFKVMPAIGELLVFKNSNEVWCRGQVINFGEKDNTFEIFAIDFGTKHVCKMNKIRQIPETYLHLPSQAVECLLDNYRERKDIDHNDCENFFKTKFMNKHLRAIVTGSNSVLSLRIQDEQDCDLGYVLKNFGYVEVASSIEPDSNGILQMS